ncbi:MAG: PqqD family protein [Rikenellaceae bacterium]
MRIVEGFTLRSVAGEMIVSGESIAQINFNKLISLNDAAAYLWQKVTGTEFTVEQLADLLVQEYGIDSQLALTDATTLADSWIKVGIVEQ